MLKQKGRQLSITDIDVLEQWSNRPLVSENSIYYALAEADDIFSDELFSSAYSHKGRPATSPAMLTKVLLLQFYENVSDRQAEERALYDLRWKVALHLPIGESGFDHSTLSNFRDRLLQNKKEQEVFQKILEKAAERKLIPQNSVRQIIDSTCTLGAGAVQDTYTLIRKSIYKLIQELQKKINIVEIVKEPLKLNYQDDSKPKIDWNNPEERNQLLNDLISDAEKLLSAIESHKLSPKGQQLKEILSKIVEQDIQRQEDGTVIIKQGVAKDRIISTSDPEMRHGRKSSSRLFDGYKTHTAMEEESEFITAVEVTPGNQHDSEAATKLIDAQPKEQQPETIMGDTAYGTGQVRAAMEDKQIKVIAPAPAEPQRPGCYPKSAFNIDLESETCQCPAGKIAEEKRYSRAGKLKAFAFSEKQCGNCPLKTECTQSKQNRRIVTVHPYEKQLQAARAFQKTEEFKEAYSGRYKIERKQSEMVRYGLRKARYIGQAKVKLQAYLIATLVNFKRLCKLTMEQIAKEPLPAIIG